MSSIVRLFYLGDAATKLKNLPEAEEAFAKYLQTARDPAGKAKVLLTLGAVKISAHKPDQLRAGGRVHVGRHSMAVRV